MVSEGILWPAGRNDCGYMSHIWAGHSISPPTSEGKEADLTASKELTCKEV